MTTGNTDFKYPRRRLIRTLLRYLSHALFVTLTEFEIVGCENLPERGPLIMVGNHFSFLDPVAAIRIAPWHLEFLGGFHLPNAPQSITWIPRLYGYYPVYRGTGSRHALRAAEAVLAQGGVLSIFPEATSAAAVLRPARPGTAYIAARSGAPLLPVGLDGMTEVFPRLRRGRRAKVTVRIGQVFGPFEAQGRGRVYREQLDDIGHEIMRRIASLIPPERRGHYSDDPAIRAAAQEVSDYPWDEVPES